MECVLVKNLVSIGISKQIASSAAKCSLATLGRRWRLVNPFENPYSPFIALLDDVQHDTVLYNGQHKAQKHFACGFRMH